MIISMKIALVCPASLPASKFSGMPYEEIYGNLELMENTLSSRFYRLKS